MCMSRLGSGISGNGGWVREWAPSRVDVGRWGSGDFRQGGRFVMGSRELSYLLTSVLLRRLVGIRDQRLNGRSLWEKMCVWGNMCT